MPSSSLGNIEPVVEFLRDLAPRRVLEVGVGHGKYGVLLREYLEVAYERYHRTQWRLELVGIEVFGEYRNPLWEYAYDRVVIEDIRRLDLASLGKFDCGLLLDVIEHFDHEEGRKVLERLLESCETVIVSTPRRFVEQGVVLGNEHERHRSLWRRQDYGPYHCRYYQGRECSVTLLSRRPLPAGAGDDLFRHGRLRRLLLRTLPSPVLELLVFAKRAFRTQRPSG